MKARMALAALLCLALLVAGCGSSNDSGGGEGATTATTAQQPRVIVEAADSGFNAAKVFREASPGVVTIRSVFANGAAEGSGFVLDSEGEIVTDAHVVTEETGGGPREPAKAVYVEFPDRNVVGAQILGFDPFADVALLKVKPEGLALHPLKLGDDATIQVGQPVAAIGSPFGEQQSLSSGIVSATDRSVKSLTKFQIEGAIQTDASINPGNSGGPLLDANAHVLGINQQIETNSGSNDGVGFAVPVSAIRHSVAMLRETGHAEYAYIGVSAQPLYPQLTEKLGLDTTFGGLIAEVVPGGPADKAGLEGGDKKLQFQAAEYRVGGDVILQVEGHDVVQPDDLSRLVMTKRPGEKITLTILHDDEKKNVVVTLGKRPDGSSSGLGG